MPFKALDRGAGNQKNGRISTIMRADTHLAERKAMRLPVLELSKVQCGYEEGS